MASELINVSLETQNLEKQKTSEAISSIIEARATPLNSLVFEIFEIYKQSNASDRGCISLGQWLKSTVQQTDEAYIEDKKGKIVELFQKCYGNYLSPNFVPRFNDKTKLILLYLPLTKLFIPLLRPEMHVLTVIRKSISSYIKSLNYEQLKNFFIKPESLTTDIELEIPAEPGAEPKVIIIPGMFIRPKDATFFKAFCEAVASLKLTPKDFEINKEEPAEVKEG